MVLCEMHHARQSPCPVLIKSLQKSAFIGQISQYFPAREEVCDWSVLTKLSLRLGLVPITPLVRCVAKNFGKKNGGAGGGGGGAGGGGVGVGGGMGGGGMTDSISGV